MKIRGRLGFGAILLLLGGFGAWLFALYQLEPSPHGFLALETPQAAQILINGLARTSVALISTLLASLFLAIPLTASMYTPRLIELFVRSWTNRLVLGLFVLSAAHAVWTSRLAAADFVPRLHILVSLALVTLSLAILLPYLFSVFRFLDPDTIIARVAALTLAAMRPTPGGGIPVRQRRLVRRVGHLGNIILKSIVRGDRDVALAAVEAVDSCAAGYLACKPSHPANWFAVDRDRFPGLSREALVFLNRDRTWVEMALLGELHRAYGCALARMPDVLGAISRANRRHAARAAAAGDREVLELAIRFFNNFLREGVKGKDPHALYDVLYQYRLLAEALWESHPESTVRIAGHIARYGRMAAQAGIPFAQDLAAYDLGALIACVADSIRAKGGPDAGIDPLLKICLAVERPAPAGAESPRSAGIVKARVLLAARLGAAGDEPRARRVEQSLADLPGGVRAAARSELAAAEEVFWEVTDRQQDFDYAAPELRDRVDAILSRLGKER